MALEFFILITINLILWVPIYFLRPTLRPLTFGTVTTIVVSTLLVGTLSILIMVDLAKARNLWQSYFLTALVIGGVGRTAWLWYRYKQDKPEEPH